MSLDVFKGPFFTNFLLRDVASLVVKRGMGEGKKTRSKQNVPGAATTVSIVAFQSPQPNTPIYKSRVFFISNVNEVEAGFWSEGGT